MLGIEQGASIALFWHRPASSTSVELPMSTPVGDAAFSPRPMLGRLSHHRPDRGAPSASALELRPSEAGPSGLPLVQTTVELGRARLPRSRPAADTPAVAGRRRRHPQDLSGGGFPPGHREPFTSAAATLLNRSQRVSELRPVCHSHPAGVTGSMGVAHLGGHHRGPLPAVGRSPVGPTAPDCLAPADDFRAVLMAVALIVGMVASAQFRDAGPVFQYASTPAR